MLGLFLALAAIPLLLVVVLAMPASVAVRVERAEQTRVRWRIRGLLGLLDVEPRGRRRRREQSPRAPAPRREAPRRSTRALQALAAVRTPGFLRRAARLLADVAQRVRWEEASLRARFGLDDPADTGCVYGALAPLLVAAHGRGWDVACRPDFDEPCLEGSAAVTLRVRPISVIAAFGAFFCSPPVLRAMGAWRSAR